MKRNKIKLNKKYISKDIYVLRFFTLFIIITYMFLFFFFLCFAKENVEYKEIGNEYNINDLKEVNIAENIKKFDVITFGKYEQDSFLENGKEDILWFILENDKEKGELTLLTKNLIECLPFHNKREDVTWKDCSLRKWLNNDFYNEAFTDEEKEYIKLTHLINRENPEFKISSGENTTDKIYLMDVYEAVDYFDDSTEKYERKFRLNKTKNLKRMGLATPQAVKNGLRVIIDMKMYLYAGNYWLRTSGNSVNRPWFHDVWASCYQCIVREDGGVRFDGTAVYSMDDGVRPMMKIRYK